MDEFHRNGMLWSRDRELRRARAFVGSGEAGSCGSIGGSTQFTPAALPNLAAWYDALDTDAILVKATQPTFADYDMEQSGVGLWTAASATLTKETASPHGGAQWLKINGLAAYVTGGTIVNNRYILTGWAKCVDGVHVPAVNIGTYDGINFDWQGTTSSSWQEFTAENTATTDRPLLVSKGTGITGWDDLVFRNLSRTRWNPISGSAGGYLSNSIIGQQPWFSDNGLKHQDDAIKSSLPASAWNHIHTTGTTFVVYKENVNQYQDFLTSFDGAAAGCYLQIQNTRKMKYHIYDTAGLLGYAQSTVAPALGSIVIAAFRITSPSLVSTWTNGGAPDTFVPTRPPGGVCSSTLQTGFSTGSSTASTYYSIISYTNALSDANVQRVGKYLAARWGGTWA